MSDFLKLIGDRLRVLRKQKGYTQEELAEKAGLQTSYIGAVERGERNIALLTLEKIIRALEISPIEVLMIDETDIHNATNDKNILLAGLKNSLSQRSAEDIKHISNILKEILVILDKRK